MTADQLSFELRGPCVAWHRMKLSRTNRSDGRGVRAYKEPKDQQFQSALAMRATVAIGLWAQSFKKPWDGTGEWHVEMEFHLQDLVRRDIDNLEKQVLDALNGITYDDDSQVVSVSKKKVLCRDNPRTVVSLRRVHGYLEERAAEAGVDLGAP